MKASKCKTLQEHKGTSETRYFDDDMNPVSWDRATRAIIKHLDEKGKILLELEGFIE